MSDQIAHNPFFQCTDCGTPWHEHGTVCGPVPTLQADLPLVCRREGEQVVIRVGIGTLAFAAEHCERFYVEEQHASGGPPYCKVIDKGELANDVIREFMHEREDGATPISLLLDECLEDARDDGSLAFADDSE
jgi:hypothetical protein